MHAADPTLSNLSTLATMLELAADAVRVTRPILEAGRRKPGQPVSQQGRDIKLTEDAASEAAIRAVLTGRSPYPILGEEGGWGQDGAADGPHWVVDPLDGSFNYYRGIPLYAVSVALCTAPGDALLGAIYDPVRDELITGGPGLGLALNGAALRRPVTTRQILATGYPTRSDPDAVTARLGAATRDWTKIRMLGSAALSLAWVALGRLDGYEEQDIMWWDVAAGLALAAGAGLGTIECRPCHDDAQDHVRSHVMTVRVAP